MNKALTQIITAMMPGKTARHRWRGILRYGLRNGLKLRRKLHREKDTPVRYYLTMCAIAKNEGRYFAEWIEWHRRQGVEKFYIYDNESTDNTREVLAPYIASGLVDYVFWKGRGQQMPVYDDCIERHRMEARWMAFIDIDEFLVPMDGRTVAEFLKQSEQFPIVEINWLVYGSGGAKKKEPGGVMERFHKHSLPGHPLNRHIKSIVDPRRVYVMCGAHEAAKISGHVADSHGNPVKKVFKDREPQQDIIRINHYAVKSYGEFLEKRARGRAVVDDIRNLTYFDQYDLNDIGEQGE